MFKNKSGILYNGDFYGRYMTYMGEFKNKRALEKMIKKFIEPCNKKLEDVRILDWSKQQVKPDSGIDLTIDYGNKKIFLIVMYDGDEDVVDDND